MTTFSIHNFGCRATDADTALLRHELQRHGLALIDDHSRADVVVLNTCTVTAAADAEARETLRKVHRANPSARIVVTGCYARRREFAPGRNSPRAYRCESVWGVFHGAIPTGFRGPRANRRSNLAGP